MISELIAVPGVLLALGIAGVYTGWKRRNVYARMADLDPTPVRQLSSPGPTEVEGTARTDDPITAPVTGREAAVAAWSVEEWDERGETSTWREVARGIETAFFEIDDGTAAVPVEPVSTRDSAGRWTQTADATASDGVRIDDVLAEFELFPPRMHFGPDEQPPEHIRRLNNDHGLPEPGSITNVVDVGNKHGKRRYREAVVEPGGEVYALGRVEGRDDAERARLYPDGATLTALEDGLLVLSDQDEASIEAEFESSARLRLVGGLVAAVLGTVGLAYLLWPTG